MGYSRDIIVYQNPSLQTSKIFELYNRLINNGWTVSTIYDNKIAYEIEPGEGFLTLDPEAERSTFEEILKEIEVSKAWISFIVVNTKLNKDATIYHQEHCYTFNLPIFRADDEFYWFNKFHEEIVPVVKEGFDLNRIEWRSGYGEEVYLCETDLQHEGILILASSNQLKQFYATNEFNHDFPEGIERLLAADGVIAIDARNLTFTTIVDIGCHWMHGYNLEEKQSITAYITFEDKYDDLLILNYSDFISICVYHKGDYKQHSGKHIVPISLGPYRSGTMKFDIWREKRGIDEKLIFKETHRETPEKVSKNYLIDIEKIPMHEIE